MMKGVEKQQPALTIKAAKGFEEQQPVQTDNGGKRFEEAATCPDDMAVTGSKSAQQARKGCASLPPEAGETSDTGSRGSGVPWSEHGQNDYPEISKKSPGKRNCQRQWSGIFRRPRRPSKN